jgi:hypothetical protein
MSRPGLRRAGVADNRALAPPSQPRKPGPKGLSPSRTPMAQEVPLQGPRGLRSGPGCCHPRAGGPGRSDASNCPTRARLRLAQGKHARDHSSRRVSFSHGTAARVAAVLHGWRSPPAFQTGAPELHDLRATLTGRPTSCAGASMPYGPPDTLGNQRSRSPWQTGSTPVMPA